MDKILLYLEDTKNRSLLASFLTDNYEVIIPDTYGMLEDDFDLCIVDGPSLARLWDHILARRNAVSTAVEPFLLLTSRKDVGMATKFLWKAVDELIITPVAKIELQARVANLLRSRRLSLELNRSIVQHTPLGIMVLDRAGQVQFWNPACERMFGWTEDEVLGRRFPVLPEAEEAKFDTILDRLFHGKTVLDQEAFRRKRDGTHMDVNFSAVPLRGADGGISSVLFIESDITERKQLEMEKQQIEEQFYHAQKMEAMGRLVGGVAHDFNNMLNVIIGYGEMVLSELERMDPLWKKVKHMVEAGHRSARLTSQLLLFSRRQMHQPKLLDLNDVVKDLAKMLKRMIGEDVDLQLVLADEICPVLADQGQMEQVIMNLVVNARDSMPKGGKLVIEVTHTELDEQYARRHLRVEPGRYVLLAVSDTGCGMDRDTVSKIFEPFFTTKEKGKGTGLGLSVVYGIVRQSRGSIWVYSEKGRGTTFKIYLPYTEEGMLEKGMEAPIVPDTGSGEHILVVEDEYVMREMVSTVLRELGYKVSIASNGTEALLMQKNGLSPALVIADVVMPDMSGSELVAQLQKHHPALKVLYMSGYTDEALAEHGMFDRDINFIQKPFTMNEIAGKIQSVLQGK